MDDALFPALNQQAANAALDAVMPVITNLHKTVWFWAALLVILPLLARRGGRIVWIAAACAILAVGLGDVLSSRVIKKLYVRDRPCVGIKQETPPDGADRQFRVNGEWVRVPVGGCPGSPSFPSNHATNTMAGALVGWRFTDRRRLRWLWFLVPLVIGFSRIYLGFHYPSDVLAGWILGAAIGAAALLAFRGRFTAQRDAAPPESSLQVDAEPPKPTGISAPVG